MIRRAYWWLVGWLLGIDRAWVGPESQWIERTKDWTKEARR